MCPLKKGLFLLTTESDPLERALKSVSGPMRQVRVHLPAGDVLGNALCLFTGLFPGKILQEGPEGIVSKLLLLQSPYKDIGFSARVPAEFERVVPKRSVIHAPHQKTDKGTVNWVHLKRVEKHEESQELRKASQNHLIFVVSLFPTSPFVDLPQYGFISDIPETQNLFQQAPVSLLDLLQILLAVLGPQQDFRKAKRNLSEFYWDRPFIREDWRLRLFGVFNQKASLTAQAGRYPLPTFLRRLRIRIKSCSPPRLTFFWDWASEVKKVGKYRLFPVSGSGDPAEQERLFAFLQNHISRYLPSNERQILGRLKDLGYL